MKKQKDFENLKVINIALKRSDGKVECDTIFSKDYLTEENARDISAKFDCDVIISHLGELVYHTKRTIDRLTIIIEKEKKEGENNADTSTTTDTTTES